MDCTAKYIEAKVEDSSTGNIKCPGLNYKQLLDPLSCKPLIPKSTSERWCDLLCDSTVFELEKCYCPYQNCSALVLKECKGNLKKVQCPNCNRDFCFQCQVSWHAGYTCNESGQLRDRNDVLAGQLTELKRWTRCYHCGHSVEPVSGCRDINCRCGARFCHLCDGRSHLGPCMHESSGDGLCFLLVLAMSALFGCLIS